MPQTDFNLKIIDEFRANGGETSGPFKGRPLLLLTTTGAKSGETHTTPLVYSKDGDRCVIIASMGGAPKHPAWYFNIRANPDVTLEIGTEKFQATATIAEGAERDRGSLVPSAAARVRMPGAECGGTVLPTSAFPLQTPMPYSLLTAVYAGGKSAYQPTLLALSPRTWPTANREQPRPNGVAGAGYPLPGATPDTMAAAGKVLPVWRA